MESTQVLSELECDIKHLQALMRVYKPGGVCYSVISQGVPKETPPMIF